MTNIYDLSFEKRIRIKYLTFGIILGFTGLAFLHTFGSLGGMILSNYLGTTLSGEDLRLNMIIMNGMFLMFIPLIYWMWFSKAKPKRHPELNETVGLKNDWDMVMKN